MPPHRSKSRARLPELLVDQRTADDFPDEQLQTHLLREACEQADIEALIRVQDGYDYSYVYISTFMADHIVWHSRQRPG